MACSNQGSFELGVAIHGYWGDSHAVCEGRRGPSDTAWEHQRAFYGSWQKGTALHSFISSIFLFCYFFLFFHFFFFFSLSFPLSFSDSFSPLFSYSFHLFLFSFPFLYYFFLVSINSNSANSMSSSVSHYHTLSNVFALYVFVYMLGEGGRCRQWFVIPHSSRRIVLSSAQYTGHSPWPIPLRRQGTTASDRVH